GDFGRWREAINPLHSFADTLGWTRRKHAFKAGGEYRHSESNAFSDPNITPRVVYGQGGFPVQGIDSTFIPGLNANSASGAQNLLTDLAGSIGSISETFTVKKPTDLRFYGYPDVENFRRWWNQTEVSAFLKDDWKVRSN